MNFTIFHYSVSVRGTLIILLSVILLGTVFIVFDISPPSSIIFHNNNIARRIGLGNIPGKCTKRTKIVFLKTHKVRKGYLVCDLIYITSCYLLQPGYLYYSFIFNVLFIVCSFFFVLSCTFLPFLSYPSDMYSLICYFQCASTSLQNILFRFGEKHNLTHVLGNRGNYLGGEKAAN